MGFQEGVLATDQKFLLKHSKADLTQELPAAKETVDSKNTPLRSRNQEVRIFYSKN